MKKGATILIVDDDEINLDIVEANLGSIGYEILRSCDGQQAKETTNQRRPDLVITDILMPNMDGYQLCRELKADPELRHIPIIFHSATYTDEKDRELALSLGAARFVRKPEDPQRLAQLVAEVLTEHPSDAHSEGEIKTLDNETYLSRYNRRLVSKLEDKLNQLDATNLKLTREIERSRNAERHVRRLAFTDSLTGLLNRSGFVLEASQIFSADDDRRFALIEIDIDGFWEINHTLGHRKGSMLLQLIGERLATFETEDEYLLARVGGDEFALMIPAMHGDKEIAHTARRLLDSLEAAFDIDGLLVEVTANAGISFRPDHGEDPVLLLRHAEVAIRGTQPSRGLVSLFEPRNDPFQPQRLELISEFRKAIREGELELYYQPKIDLVKQCVVGAEALLRWNHPGHGLLTPDAFVAIAEQTGQMRALTGQVLRFGLSEFATWQRKGFILDLSLNLSARNLIDDELPEDVSALLTQNGIAGENLTLEITESALLRDPARARGILERLAAMGAKIAIDDFGTGYSSLSHLRVLPVDELKIDKSFVMNMTENENDRVIVRSTIELAHNLGLKVTAEGVERTGIYELLRSLNCDMAQGFLMGRPMPSAEFTKWLFSSPAGLPNEVFKSR